MKTKRFLGLFTAMVMLMSSFAALNVSAANWWDGWWGSDDDESSSSITAVEFYVQRRGVQLDTDGSVESQPSSLFTPVLYNGGKLKEKKAPDFTMVYNGKDVTSQDILDEIRLAPQDFTIFQKIRQIYSETGNIYTTSGEPVDWNDFTTERYEMRWYVLKLEDVEENNKYNSGVWHVDGVIVDKETDEPIEIVTPSDPTPEPVEPTPGPVDPTPEPVESPEPVEPTPEPVEPALPEYSSRFAYIYGYSDTTMGAEGTLLRGEISAMLHRLVKQNDPSLGGFVYNESAEPVFADIVGQWFRSGIEFMNSKSAFEAAAGENVYPNQAVTRGEAFKLISLGLSFTENADMAYDDYAALLYNAGYVEGDENGKLNIDSNITRAEFCTIYNRIIGRDGADLVTADGAEVTAETYGFKDMTDPEIWYYDTMIKATSSYDEDGYVDLELREDRNALDDYNG